MTYWTTDSWVEPAPSDYGNIGGGGETVVLSDTPPAYDYSLEHTHGGVYHAFAHEEPIEVFDNEGFISETPWEPESELGPAEAVEDGPWPWSAGWSELGDDLIPGDQSGGFDLSLEFDVADVGAVVTPWGAIGGEAVGEADPSGFGGFMGIMQILPIFLLMSMLD